jgi:hypothetical protein
MPLRRRSNRETKVPVTLELKKVGKVNLLGARRPAASGDMGMKKNAGGMEV